MHQGSHRDGGTSNGATSNSATSNGAAPDGAHSCTLYTYGICLRGLPDTISQVEALGSTEGNAASSSAGSSRSTVLGSTRRSRYRRKRDPRPSSEIPCENYEMGFCQNGDWCIYAHIGPPGSAVKNHEAEGGIEREESEEGKEMKDLENEVKRLTLSKKKEKSKRKKGKRNKFKNEKENEEGKGSNDSGTASSSSKAQKQTPSKRPECAICFEQPCSRRGSRYGLLENCDHPLCLRCARAWRSGSLCDPILFAKHATRRVCPVCRIKSNFIIPSHSFVTGEEKPAVIQAYKDNLAQIRCKYYSEDRRCPFTYHCFYRHENPDGTLVDRDEERRKEEQRISRGGARNAPLAPRYRSFPRVLRGSAVAMVEDWIPQTANEETILDVMSNLDDLDVERYVVESHEEEAHWGVVDDGFLEILGEG